VDLFPFFLVRPSFQILTFPYPFQSFVSGDVAFYCPPLLLMGFLANREKDLGSAFLGLFTILLIPYPELTSIRTIAPDSFPFFGKLLAVIEEESSFLPPPSPPAPLVAYEAGFRLQRPFASIPAFPPPSASFFLRPFMPSRHIQNPFSVFHPVLPPKELFRPNQSPIVPPPPQVQKRSASFPFFQKRPHTHIALFLTAVRRRPFFFQLHRATARILAYSPNPFFPDPACLSTMRAIWSQSGIAPLPPSSSLAPLIFFGAARPLPFFFRITSLCFIGTPRPRPSSA